jgi:hypothetical protein
MYMYTYICICIFVYIIIDHDIARSAQIPYADVQMDAIIWLEDAAENSADQSPTKLNVFKFSNPSKRSIYDGYEKEFKEYGVEYVNYSKFIEVWNATCPYFLLRADSDPDIPGKCKTCAGIEGLKNSCNDRAVSKGAKQLHHLHNGGMVKNARKLKVSILF